MPETYAQQLSHFTNFLLAYVHTILYLRSLYPESSFVRSRFHNTPVYQSRHPLVCEWVRDAISAVHSELLSGTAARIGVVIYHHRGDERSGSVQVMERYMLDVSQFPVVEKGEREMEIDWEPPSHSPGLSPHDSEEEDAEPPTRHNKGKGKEKAKGLDADVPIDLSEQFRAALIMLNTRCSSLKPLPKNCSYNIVMELKDEPDIDPPVGHPQPWIPVQKSLQKTGRKRMGEEKGEQAERMERKEGQDLGGVRVTPIRTVEAGVFVFEAWVEEGKAKFEVDDTSKSSFASSNG